MDRKFLKIPVTVFVLAFITALFVLIPLFFLFNQLNNRLAQISTALYVIASTEQPILTPSEASVTSKVASPSGRSR